MRVAHVVATLDDPAAGPSHSVANLCASLRAQGTATPLHTVAGWRSTIPMSGDTVQRHRQDFPTWPILGRLCLSADLHRALLAEAASLDVLHAHGLWLMANIYPGWVAQASGLPLVVSPRGMLGAAALRFSRIPKRLCWRLLQERVARSAACLHATSHAELAEIRAMGLVNPVAVIRNGVDLTPPATAPAPALRTVLALGRIHPKKGLDILLRAWRRVEQERPGWRLRIVGPDEGGHAASLAALAQELGVTSLSLEEPLFGEARTAAYQSAEIFVLPSLNENFALTVAEALAAGVCVIASKGVPWAELDTQGCGWWIDHGVDALEATLLHATQLPAAELREKGARGRAWMAEAFSWQAVAAEMTLVYRWLAEQGDRPPCVQLV